MLIALVAACVRLHGLYSGEPAAVEAASPVWPILFIVADGFLFLSVAALAITQFSQVRARRAPAPSRAVELRFLGHGAFGGEGAGPCRF